MSLDATKVGRRYGPYLYEVGGQKLREFAQAITGGVPSPSLPGEPLPPAYESGAIAPPSFANVFAIVPFFRACTDPELGIDPLMLVHGEQSYDFLAPVRAGDRLETIGTIAEVLDKPGKKLVVVTTETKNAAGALVVRARFTAVVIV
jgi:hypothetical protein